MSMKDNDYICPSCKGHLNVGNYLVFATNTQRKHKVYTDTQTHDHVHM